MRDAEFGDKPQDQPGLGRRKSKGGNDQVEEIFGRVGQRES